jgi:REP element-mobilizing transposase RayT
MQPRLYDYMGGIIRSEKGVLMEIGGLPDHIHLLISWRPDKSISDLMRNLKAHSSGWAKNTFPAAQSFAWQEGYAVFSVSQSQAGAVGDYIRHQIEHHRGREFKVELLALLRAHEIEFDERFVFD